MASTDPLERLETWHVTQQAGRTQNTDPASKTPQCDNSELEQLQEAIRRHFVAAHSVVPWSAVVIDNNGDLQSVTEPKDGDLIAAFRSDPQ